MKHHHQRLFVDLLSSTYVIDDFSVSLQPTTCCLNITGIIILIPQETITTPFYGLECCFFII